MKYMYRVLLGLVLAGAIIFLMSRAISWQDAKNSVLALRWNDIALIIGVVFAISLAKATRFYFILNYGDVPVSLMNTFRIFVASQAFTPMPGGELGRAILFKNELGVHLKEVAGPVFLQALMELWTAALWVVFAAFLVGNIFGIWIIGLFALLAILTAPLLLAKRLPGLLDILKRHGMAYKWIDKTQSTFRHFGTLVSSKGKRKAWRFWIVIVALGLLAHAVSGGLLWYIAHSVGGHITILQGIFATTAAALIQGIFTFIPGGLGVTEGGLVGILSGFAVPLPKTIVMILLYRVATLPLSIFISILFLTVIYGKKLIHRASST